MLKRSPKEPDDKVIYVACGVEERPPGKPSRFLVSSFKESRIEGKPGMLRFLLCAWSCGRGQSPGRRTSGSRGTAGPPCDSAQRPSPFKPPQGVHWSGQPSPPRSRPTQPRGAEAGSGGAESHPACGPSPAVEDGLLPGAQPVCLGCHGVRKLHELAAEGRLAQQQDRGVHAGGPGRGAG